MAIGFTSRFGVCAGALSTLAPGFYIGWDAASGLSASGGLKRRLVTTIVFACAQKMKKGNKTDRKAATNGGRCGEKY
ncbi:MAG: hypothetical protein ACRD5F_01110 [Candidatus Acidiferrales bacterium]